MSLNLGGGGGGGGGRVALRLRSVFFLDVIQCNYYEAPGGGDVKVTHCHLIKDL